MWNGYRCSFLFDPDPAAGAGGTVLPPPPEETTGKADLAAEPENIVLEVGGQMVTVTPERAKELAIEGLSVGDLRQQIETLTPLAQKTTQYEKDLRAWADDGDPAAFGRLAGTVGMGQPEIDQVLGNLETEKAGSPDGIPKEWLERESSLRKEIVELRRKAEEASTKRIGYSDLTENIQTSLLGVEESRIGKIVKTSLDTDPIIGYYMREGTEQAQMTIRTMIDEQVTNALQTSKTTFGDGSHVMPGVLKKVGEILKSVGTPVTKTDLGGLSVGVAPSVDGAVGNMYAQTKDPDPVSAVDSPEAFSRYITEKFVHKLRTGDVEV